MCLSLEQIEKFDDLVANQLAGWLSFLEQSDKWSKMAKSRDPLSILLMRAFHTCVRTSREEEPENLSGMERAVSLSAILLILLSRLAFPRLGVFAWRNSSQADTFLNAVRWINCELHSSPQWSAVVQQWPERAADFVISKFAGLMYGDPHLSNAFAPIAQRAARLLQIEFRAVCHRTFDELTESETSKIHVDGYGTPNASDISRLASRLLAAYLQGCMCYRDAKGPVHNVMARENTCLSAHNLQSFIENPQEHSLYQHVRRAITGCPGPLLSGSFSSGMLWRYLETGIEGVSLPAFKYGHVVHRICAGCGLANYLFSDGRPCPSPCGATEFLPGLYVNRTKWILRADHENAGWNEVLRVLCGKCSPRFAMVASSRQEQCAMETQFRAFIDPDSRKCTHPSCAASRTQGARETTVFFMSR